MAGRDDRPRDSVEPDSLAERTRWPDGSPGGRTRIQRLKRLLATPIRYWRVSLVACLILLGGAVVVTGSAGDIAADVDGWVSEQADEEQLNATDIEERIHQQVNEERANRSVARLDWDADLAAIAQGHSTQMANEQFYAHESPSGETFEDRYEDAGYACRIPLGNGQYAVGSENLGSTYAYIMIETEDGATQYDTNEEVADAIVQSWMTSKPHRENLLKPYWDDHGIGVSLRERTQDSGVRVYVTQNFC
ncbi:CAP domain-containing protein [Halobacterium hubeiense]|uniref:CAP domain-containing protein n=1 Tax=Halobacterium hubeiense TaxID=1407499 RepID=UPI003C7431C7